jgi:hypothetical protein
VDRGFSHGTVYWRDGSVRYDNFSIGKFSPNGQRLIYKTPKVQSVVRSHDMLAYTEQNPAWGLFLTVVKPPRSAEEWEYQTAFAPHRHLDSWLHYARPFCTDRKTVRDYWESCHAIESEEEAGKVLLRFLRVDTGGRMEVICDQAADWLPVRLRAGQIREGKWIVFVEITNEWRKVSGVWYPNRYVKTSYFGIDQRPVKEIDLTVRSLRANGAANVLESVFTLSAMNVPEGTGGLDKRFDPPRGLVRSGGVIRQPRPGEGPNPKNVHEMEIERQKDEETVPAAEPGTPGPRAPVPGSPVAAKALVSNQEYVSLLDGYEAAHRNGEKAILEAKTNEEQRAAILALGGLEWSYARRFLALARKYPADPVAIDALGGLVANQFTPPEAEQAAAILIRDHLASDKLIPIYHQLVTTLFPAPSSAAERLLRAAAEKGPTPDTRGLASLKLAELLKYRADAIRMLRGLEPDPFYTFEELARSGGREPVKRTDEDPDTLTKQAEQFFDRVVQRYADVRGKNGTLGEAAAKALFHLRVLAVGKPALDVEGTDMDGQPFRLSDYRGKTVVLTFSGSFGRDRHAHARALVERMKGRPFAMLSVNIDNDKDSLRKSLAAGEITWRCWWEGGMDGPNCRRWRLGFIPSVYVIDADGIIRAKDVKGKALDEAVDVLMDISEARKAASAPTSRASRLNQ